ncbi:MAG: copper resistance system multicopper oxidase [Acetobacteraceae bacterium]|nr:copper resistance system multicopper oxidase [Acetobacteraceae bacterium]
MSLTVPPTGRGRRVFLGSAATALATRLDIMPLARTAAAQAAAPGQPRTFDLAIAPASANFTGRTRPAMAINGTIPGPLLRFREGEDVVVNVTNRLDETTSLHWHGLIIPSAVDGVPGISDGFWGIPAGTTFTYRLPIRQSGTYWYHAHSGTQEQSGVYGPLIIDPARPDPIVAERDYLVMFSDWTDEGPDRVLANLKRDSSWYNFNQRTLVDLVRELAGAPTAERREAILRDRLDWGNMRMDPTDIEDVASGYTFLANGVPPGGDLTLLFRPGERVRLRLINGSAMTYQDVRIPGLSMTVVQAHGNPVRPVEVDEIRMATAETYDVVVQPREARAYSVLAESTGRQGYARAVLAPREGMPPEPLPPHRPRPVLTMADMNMNPGPTGLDRGTPCPERDQPGQVAPMSAMGDMGGGGMAGMGAGAAPGGARGDGTGVMPGMDHGAMGGGAASGAGHGAMGGGAASGAGHGAMGGMAPRDPFAVDTGAPPGTRVLSYRNLRALSNRYGAARPDRTIEVRLTGNMQRYIWSMNGAMFWNAQPIVLEYGNRVRIRFINETMMNHAMHLHGLWMIPQVGNGDEDPLLHTVNVQPGTTLDVDVVADAEGGWAFHCHLLYHMEAGMMRKVEVRPAGARRLAAACPRG